MDTKKFVSSYTKLDNIDDNIKDVLYSLYEEAMFKNEYSEELYDSKIMSNRDSKIYTDGYIDGIIFALSTLTKGNKEEIEQTVNTLIKKYDDESISELTQNGAEFSPGTIYLVNGFYRVITESRIITNRKSNKKVILGYISSISSNIDMPIKDKRQFTDIVLNDKLGEITIDLDSYNLMMAIDTDGSMDKLAGCRVGYVSSETLKDLMKKIKEFSDYREQMYDKFKTIMNIDK